MGTDIIPFVFAITSCVNNAVAIVPLTVKHISPPEHDPEDEDDEPLEANPESSRPVDVRPVNTGVLAVTGDVVPTIV